MARIRFAPDAAGEIDRQYTVWRLEQPRLPNQLGGTIYMEVIESSTVRHFPDAFVDKLERLGIPLERL
jgi:hypothetical protein